MGRGYIRKGDYSERDYTERGKGTHMGRGHIRRRGYKEKGEGTYSARGHTRRGD